MPKCKYCGERISKLNKEICPYCGNSDPIDKNTIETDTTGRIDLIEDEEISVKKPTKQHFFMLTLFLGMFGAQFLYLKKWKHFLINLFSSIIFFIIFFLIFYLGFNLLTLGLVLSLVCLIIIQIIFAFLIKFDVIMIKDKDGVFIN